MRIFKHPRSAAFACVVILAVFSSCNNRTATNMTFTGYPEMKIGFSTQNFMQAMPLTVESLEELISYAAGEGYQFIELRDPRAGLSRRECERLAAYADSLGIEVIYEIHVNLLHPDFPEVFERGLHNTVLFGNPGILRAPLTGSEFEGKPDKTGWTIEELTAAALLAVQCAKLAADTGISFAVENTMEPFFGSSPEYFGLSDFFKHAENVGLQFDLSNAFVAGSRKAADPGEVAGFLDGLGERWVTTHVKTALGGVAQPVVGENPLPVKQVTGLMGRNKVHYFALELVAAEAKEGCFANHEASIKYLVELGILEKK